jgi:signal transduction histidine kinase
LFLARAEGDGGLPHPERIVLADWLPDYLERWRQHERRADLTLCADREAAVTASKPLLGQALDNLLTNALKYSPAGSPVRIQVALRAGTVTIGVEDQGIGVPPEEREAIFHPFYRARAARQLGVEGSGLGLALVERIARALGGEVRCEDASTGTRFTLVLPQAPPLSAAPQAKPAAATGRN